VGGRVGECGVGMLLDDWFCGYIIMALIISTNEVSIESRGPVLRRYPFMSLLARKW